VSAEILRVVEESVEAAAYHIQRARIFGEFGILLQHGGNREGRTVT